MKTNSDKNKRIWITFGIIVGVFLLLGIAAWLGGALATGYFEEDMPPTPTVVLEPTATLPLPTPSEAVDQTNPIPFESVVQLHIFYKEYGDLKLGWTGSGTIISADGLILTNAHVVLPNDQFPVDAIGVALSLEDDQPPTILYYAEVLQANKRLDIAVVQIVTDVKGNPMDSSTLDLPFVPLGNADDLKLGDSLTILGYPGIGGETITLTRGEVGGFTTEEEFGDRAFIKTSATIAGGNSGGLAADAEGRLVGVPTQLGYGGSDQFVDCRVLADTNRDGKVNGLDSCVPTGGFINALRPINLAMPLIEAALGGQVAIVDSDEDNDNNLPEQGEVIFQDDFSDTAYADWESIDDQEYSIGYLDSEYQIRVIKDNLLVRARPNEYFEDIVISVDVRSNDSIGNADYGIICRYQDSNNYYALEITEDGYYGILKVEEGEFHVLVDWRRSSHIPRDEAVKTLTVACVGSRLSIAVNGEFLVEARDSTFLGGDVGLIVGTFDKGGAKIIFDNFTVREPFSEEE